MESNPKEYLFGVRIVRIPGKRFIDFGIGGLILKLEFSKKKEGNDG